MRRLLIKLVAIETMLVGWLSYWIFLIYANNPTVSAGLGDQLSKFPQLAFTTVDLAVLVIIASFAITLAFKFHRGLRPGIRLERALQMLENLMKRNLILEAQVAELRVEKVEKTPPRPIPGLSSLPFSGSRSQSLASVTTAMGSEPGQGSWEKAFRTPLEAGTPAAKVPSSRVSEPPLHRENAIAAPRIEEPPPIASPSKTAIISEKPVMSMVTPIDNNHSDRPVPSTQSSTTPSSGWEDSPKFVGESQGILTPSSAKKGTLPSPSPVGFNQPYIPAPAPRMTPPSVIVGPMNQKPSSPTRQTPKPIVRPTFSMKTTTKEPPPSSIELTPPSPPIIIDKTDSRTDSRPLDLTKLAITTGEEETKEKAPDKPPVGSRKKVSDEKD